MMNFDLNSASQTIMQHDVQETHLNLMKNDHLIKAVARRLRIQNRSPVISPE